MRQAKPLKSKYGKLTVLDTFSEEGRRYCKVRCTCGREKVVLAQSLRAGATRSCGHGACKDYPRLTRKAGFKPPIPRTLKPATIQRAWAKYNHEKASQRRSVAELSEEMKINANTLSSVFRAIRLTGGIEPYMKAIQNES